MNASSSHGPLGRTLLRRLLLVSASLAIGTVIWFLLGDSEGLVAEEKFLPAAHAATPAPSHVIAHVDGVAIMEEDVVIDVANELAEIEERRRELLRAALESRIADQLIASEAVSRGMSVDELLAVEVDAKLETVTDEALAARIDTSGTLSPEAVTAEEQWQLRRQIRLETFIAELREAAAVSVYGEPAV